MNADKSGQSAHGFQEGLFGGLELLKTRVITRQKDFDSLFDGFSKMRAVSYVASPGLLLEFFDKRGYREIEIVVGENLSGNNLSNIYRNDLEKKGIQIIERLVELQNTGVFRVFIPEHTIHTKMFILEGDNSVRVIQTSANLTETAQKATRQTNYVWYLDLPPGHSLLAQFQRDYESHRGVCTLFLDDLNQLINEHPDMDKKQVIEAWVKGEISAEEDIGIKKAFHEISASVLRIDDANKESVAVLHLPQIGGTRKQIEKVLAPLKPLMQQNEMHLDRLAYIKYFYETYHIPLLVPYLERKELLLGFDGKITVLSEAPSDPLAVNRGLEHIETYLNTVDSGKSTNSLFVKLSMYEALLYIFFTPFANEYMKAKRAKYLQIDNRGPRFLYIYGRSQNGKTTFLRFALKMLTGKTIVPLSREDFTRKRILNVSSFGTAFPLVFDDVDPSRTPGMEDIFKSYWERTWQEQYISPQIVVTSNSSRLKDWGKSRVKRIDFDVNFIPNETDKYKLASLFSETNPIFKWFSHIYLNQLGRDELPSDDELKIARAVLKELYEYAGRQIPEFFPNEPIERLYDPGRKDWRDAIHNLRKATVRQDGNRTLITFSTDIQHWEINDYLSFLPQNIKCQRKGNTIIIENPDEFKKWLGEKPQTGFSLRNLFQGKDR